MGADHVIDYTREDFTQNGQRYDLILAVNGYHPIFAYRRALSRQGIFVMAGASGKRVIQALPEVMLFGALISRKGGQQIGFMGIAKIKRDDLEVLNGLLEDGKVAPVIDRRYPLSQTAEAFRYLGEGHARGKVIIEVDHEEL